MLFYNCIIPRDFSHGKFWLLSPEKVSSRYPTYCACWVFECFHNPWNFDMDYRIFNVHTDVNACDCARECMDMYESLHWKLTLGETFLAAPGDQTCISSMTLKCSPSWATFLPYPELIYTICDFIDPPHWVSIATDLIVWLSLIADEGLQTLRWKVSDLPSTAVIFLFVYSNTVAPNAWCRYCSKLVNSWIVWLA